MPEPVSSRVVTRVEFAIKYAHNGKTEPISTSTAERFLAQGSTRGRVGILMRRESGPGFTGEWLPQDRGSAGTETGTRLAAAAPDLARIEKALTEAWDDGNATGLDGFTGPGRGAGDIDPEAIYSRDRVIRKVLSELRSEAVAAR